MADEPVKAASTPTLKGAIMTLNPKIVLAFFNIVLAAALVVYFIHILINRPAGSQPLDAGTVALLAGFITTFLLMAKSSSDYQFVSSSGSDKKDDAQTAVSKALADKVPAPSVPVTPSPSPVPGSQPWWPKLTDAEKNVITAASTSDPRVAAFITAAQTGAANADDLAYLVTKNLLTQDRATAIATV